MTNGVRSAPKFFPFKRDRSFDACGEDAMVMGTNGDDKDTKERSNVVKDFVHDDPAIENEGSKDDERSRDVRRCMDNTKYLKHS